MSAETTPADYVRVEIRRGNATTVYELEALPDWPVEVSEEVDVPSQDVQVGIMVHRMPGLAKVDLTLSGKMLSSERTTKPAAHEPARRPNEGAELSVHLYTHKLGVALDTHLSYLPADMQTVLRPHVDHATWVLDSPWGWRKVHCDTCNVEVWSR